MIRPTLLTGHHKALRKGERYAEGRFLFVADVLLHETIHQYHQEVTGETEESYKGHGPNFRDTCNVMWNKTPVNSGRYDALGKEGFAVSIS